MRYTLWNQFKYLVTREITRFMFCDLLKNFLALTYVLTKRKISYNFLLFKNGFTVWFLRYMNCNISHCFKLLTCACQTWLHGQQTHFIGRFGILAQIKEILVKQYFCIFPIQFLHFAVVVVAVFVLLLFHFFLTRKFCFGHDRKWNERWSLFYYGTDFPS